MVDPVYLFTGMGGEYVLAPLAAYFRAKGHKVVEIDFVFTPEPYRLLKSLIGQRVVHTTSAHPDFDYHAHKEVSKTENESVSTLEIFQYLKPEATFYVAHDLTTPLVDNEVTWLPFFTASLNPLPNMWWYRKFAPAFEVGWIRKNNTQSDQFTLQSHGNRHKFIYFPTYFTAHRDLGVDGIYNLYRPMLERNVPIKLFNWAGVEKIEEGLRALGAQVVPAATSAYSLMKQADAVICIGGSSTAIEAYLMGIPLVCLQNVMIDYRVRREDLSGLYDIKYMTVPEINQWVLDLNEGRCQLPTRAEDKLLPFDFEKAHDIIINFRR